MAATSVDYQKDIRPILQQRCYACHSRLKQKSNLRLDAGALILKGGKAGVAVTPGDSAASPLLKRISSVDESERMPPEGRLLTAEQISLLKRWIDQGASYPRDEIIPPLPSEHWSFQPVHRPPLPRIKDRSSARNPIDLFVLAKMEARSWRSAPNATPRALLRRVYLDLTGLPPTPAEQAAFLSAPEESAFSRVIDDLLGRPAYGERWARHWLDLVRYAESNGYERDAAKPFVWRYRDYVISSFNADKPFDRFSLEQLAGDELSDATAETLIATGYHRLGPWDDEPSDPDKDRFDQLDDIVSTTSQVFLGLTLGCARCHDHKFEPLETKDYYRLVAVFAPLQRPHDGRTELTRPAGSRAELAALAERDQHIAALQKDISLAKTNGPADRVATLERKIQTLRDTVPDLSPAYFFHEPPSPPALTHILARGNPGRPGPEVSPAVPAVLVKRQPDFSVSGATTSQRRLTLARWLVGPDNPLTARVLVNRVWQFHFGTGLVRTPSDFGVMGEPPTHPELLDWLADWFVHDAHWSLKKLHRLILTSHTWQQSRAQNDAYAAADPENRLLWRMPYHRLEVEAIRDSILVVSGQLNRAMFGPSMYPEVPRQALEGSSDPDQIWKPFVERDAARRTIYAFIKRSLIVPLLEVLDLGDTTQSCPQRAVTTVAPQALTLFNGDFVNRQARHFAQRLHQEAGKDSAKQIDLAFRLALCRPPTMAERTAMLNFLKQETARNLAESSEKSKPPAQTESNNAAMIQMCRVILNLNEFVYPE